MNWVEFLNANGVDYVTRGGNTKKGEISIACPYCGPDDPSQHLGISLTAENWGCLRNASHRGHKPESLITAILGCSYPQAKLVAAQYSRPDPDSLEGSLLALDPTSEAAKPDEGLRETLPEFRPITQAGSTSKFWRYLESRGFDAPYRLITQYRLSCCTSGQFKDRLIIPFYWKDELVAWTGRAIAPVRLAPRYLSSKLVKTIVFNGSEQTRGGKLLFIVEGPFDALKLDYYGRGSGARAVAVSGTSMSVEQLVILGSIIPKFEKVVVLFDADAVEPSFSALDWLHSPNVTLGELDGAKDPGAMTQQQVEHLTRRYL